MKTISDTKLRVARFGDAAEMRVYTESLDTREGRLQSFTHRTQAGGVPIVLEGTVLPQHLALTTRSAGKETVTQLPWDPAQGGFFAVEQSLRQAPMKPGEQRTVSFAMPGLTGIQRGTATLKAHAPEATALLDGSATLLRISQRLVTDGLDLDGTCWTDSQGEMLKAAVPALQQETYRTTRDRAERYGQETGFDIGFDTIVRLDTPLPHGHASRRAVYEATLTRKNPVELFVTGASQQVEPLDDHRARLTVRAIRPGEPPTVPVESPPTDADRQPNHLIQSDNGTIVELAARIEPDSSHPWQIAQALERWVHETIQQKDYSQGFATAADVAQTLVGDCTEHAVLLAALCRARQIPARVCVGLVYSAADQGFAFHMWNEVWIADRWVPLDATLGRGGIGAAHLKLRHTDLAGDQGETAILSVLDVMHQLQLRVVEVE
ncbi:MAG: transglutaminase-like domain-containing protein [Pirellulaceae bacterium]|nr:transglutaminase-like domain-containing protein [Pirellulaceae bacterium]